MYESQPPVRRASPGSPGAQVVVRAPAGWPRGVLPPGAPGWETSVTGWLLDQCPSEFRAYPNWRRQPIALGWIAQGQLEAQVVGLRASYRSARVELGQLSPEAVALVMQSMEAEGLRLRALLRAVEMVNAALRGETFIPRL